MSVPRPATPDRDAASIALPALAARGSVGGVLMGLANLVPGISGGTMLLAAGVYPRFIQAVADVTTLRLNRPSLVVLGSVVLAAMVAVLLGAGIIKDLVVDHRWVMYSLFIGLTLGGVPVVWRLAAPVDGRVWAGAAVGFVGMALLALAQQRGAAAAGGAEAGWIMFALAGVAGASAMILPGVSGGYLLLVMGMYIPILSGVDAFKLALEARDAGAILDVGLRVVLPVGLGVVVGVVGISNLLKWLLARHAGPTLGVLLGLLVGAVVGLWPFQETLEPTLGETIIKGRVVTAETLHEFDREDYPTAFFRPGTFEAAGAVGLVLAGVLATTLVARLGRERDA